jgi:membrane protease YdiL (CAAX protease family)
MPTLDRARLAGLLLVGMLPYWLNGFYNPLLKDRPAAFWTAEIITWIVMPVVVVALGLRAGLYTRSDIGLHTRVAGRRSDVLLLVAVVAAVPLLYTLDRWAVATAVGLWETNYGAAGFQVAEVLPPPGPTTGHLRLLAVMHFVLTAGFVEEIYYRGMMSRLFPDGWMGTMLYVPVSSLVFASVHWEGGVQTMFEALTFGLAAGAIFRGTRNLWPLIAAHAVIDYGWIV